MHTLSSMHTLSILSIQHPSPIQQLSPMVMFHGDLITTLFFKTRPLPILAPNSLRTAILGNINGFHDALTKNAFTKYQIIVLILPAPLSKFEPSKAAKFTLFCMVLISLFFFLSFPTPSSFSQLAWSNRRPPIRGCIFSFVYISHNIMC